MSLRSTRATVALLALFIALAASAISPRPSAALDVDGNAVVGTGSPASCTEAAFDAAFSAVQGSGGGIITFNCGASPVTILFSYQKAVSAPTELRGAGLITLSGNNARSLFQVYSDKSLTLDNLTLTRAYGTVGAVENFGKLVVKNSRLTSNSATASGGAIASYGELSISNSVISGNSAAKSGGGLFLDGGTATITASQLADNTALTSGGAILSTLAAALTIDGSKFTGNKGTDTFAQGGAVRAEGNVTIKESTFAGNSSSRGGALSVGGGTTKVSRTTMAGNWGAYGGAIRQEGGDLTLTDVVVDANGYGPSGQKITTGGGGLSWGSGTAHLSNTSITNNWASYGGGFDHAGGTVDVTNVTISANAAVGSGGIDTSAGSLTLTNVTIANNSALTTPGGIALRGGSLTVKNVLLSGNYRSDTLAKSNCSNTLPGGGFSLSSDLTCGLGGGRDNVSLPLRPLANNGGYTLTHLLFNGSPAVDAGTGLGCPAADQRGIARPQGAACDVGAVEMRGVDFSVRVYAPLIQR